MVLECLRSSYRHILSNQSNYHFKSTEFNNFTKLGAGLMLIDKKKELFSFIRGDFYFPHSSRQKIKMSEHDETKKIDKDDQFKNRGIRKGASQSIMIGAGGRF
jgi:hypothetical protein